MNDGESIIRERIADRSVRTIAKARRCSVASINGQRIEPTEH